MSLDTKILIVVLLAVGFNLGFFVSNHFFTRPLVEIINNNACFWQEI